MISGTTIFLRSKLTKINYFLTGASLVLAFTGYAGAQPQSSEKIPTIEAQKFYQIALPNGEKLYIPPVDFRFDPQIMKFPVFGARLGTYNPQIKYLDFPHGALYIFQKFDPAKPGQPFRKGGEYYVAIYNTSDNSSRPQVYKFEDHDCPALDEYLSLNPIYPNRYFAQENLYTNPTFDISHHIDDMDNLLYQTEPNNAPLALFENFQAKSGFKFVENFGAYLAGKKGINLTPREEIRLKLEQEETPEIKYYTNGSTKIKPPDRSKAVILWSDPTTGPVRMIVSIESKHYYYEDNYLAPRQELDKNFMVEIPESAMSQQMLDTFVAFQKKTYMTSEEEKSLDVPGPGYKDLVYNNQTVLIRSYFQEIYKNDAARLKPAFVGWVDRARAKMFTDMKDYLENLDLESGPIVQITPKLSTPSGTNVLGTFNYYNGVANTNGVSRNYFEEIQKK